MLAKRIIACLDVTNGRVVKGTNFVNLKDAGDPVELARKYDEEGIDELVFLDITASSDKRYILRDLVERTAQQVFIPFTVGGGINDLETIRDILLAGADKVSINTAGIMNPELLEKASKMFGSQCIVLAIDARKIKNKNSRQFVNFKFSQKIFEKIKIDENSIWEVYIHGGRTPTGIDAVKWAVYGYGLGVGEILLTSMDRDGTKKGFDIALTNAIARAVSIPVIASGGAGSIEHIIEVLKVCDASLMASLLHFKELTVREIKNACSDAGVLVRN